MSARPRLLADDVLRDLAARFGTPLYVYRAETIRERVAELGAFDRIRYAQKANANLAILRLLRAQGCAVDAVSAGEIERALQAGFAPAEIAFTADLFDRDALAAVARHGVSVNAGSPAMIEQYARTGAGRELTLRVNPGFGHGHDRKVNTGGEHSKHGIWHEALPEALALARAHGLRVTGLHMHIGSGSDFEHLARVREAMAACARQAREHLRSISAGGGLPVPYRAREARIDVAHYARAWRETRELVQRELGRPIELEVEPGRYLVAEAGLLLCEVRGTKRSGSIDYLLVDAGFNDLVRPAMYGAYHEISIVGLPNSDGARAGALRPQVVAGPLCESADVFTQKAGGFLEPRPLPEAREGDLLCLHDCGAYAASMASNYNGRPLAAEVLVQDGAARLVRRRQPLDDLWRLEQGLD